MTVGANKQRSDLWTQYLHYENRGGRVTASANLVIIFIIIFIIFKNGKQWGKTKKLAHFIAIIYINFHVITYFPLIFLLLGS